MPQYAYKCPFSHVTYATYTMAEQKPESHVCEFCGESATRWYGGENVSVDAAVGAINRDFKAGETRDLFLPNRKDFARNLKANEDSPVVDKAIKEWNANHEPQVKGGGKYRPK